LSTIACADDPAAPAPVAVFTLDRGEHAYFDLPWPNDLYTTAEGTVDLSEFPNPSRNASLANYLTAIQANLRGWGSNGAVYFSLAAPVDARLLPREPAETMGPGAALFLIDVDDASPHRGEFTPAAIHYHEGATVYWPEHSIAIRPVYGIPLRPNTRYAAVLTNAVKPLAEPSFARDADFAAILGTGGDDAVERARALYEPALGVIEGAGVTRDAILSMAVFTTQDSVGELVRARDWIMESFEMPQARDTSWRLLATNPSFLDTEGTFGPMPTFQHGESPYTTQGTGGFMFAADGTPVVASTFEARFSLSVPRSDMPENGYPIVLYAHGTGGDYRSYTREHIDEELASVGYAVMGFDQVLHGPRNPTSTSPDSLFFNVVNPLAARDNNRQSALDVVQQARFAASLVLPTRLGTRDERPIRFDPSRIYVYGHSQGGLNLPLFLAVDDQTRGGVLSAAGGTLAVSIIEKVEPINIAAAVWVLLGLPGATPEMALAMEDFTYEHPVLTLLQTWLEPSDTVNYGRMIAREPREGFAPKSVLQTQGRLDLFTTPASGHSLAAAIGTAIVEPVTTPLDALTLQGIEPAIPPMRGNAGEGSATTGLYQFPGGDHFVVFRSVAAQRVIRHFFATAHDGAPELQGL
jgi:hypothetical protein